MIIKCPACNSEFSVSDSVFQKAKSPLFHCNICNLFFRVSAGDILPDHVPQNPSQDTVKNHATDVLSEDSPANSMQEDTAAQESTINPDEGVRRNIKKIFSVRKSTPKKIRSQSGVWVWDYENKVASLKPHLQKVEQYIDNVNFNPEAVDGIFIDQLIGQKIPTIDKSNKQPIVKNRLAAWLPGRQKKTRGIDEPTDPFSNPRCRGEVCSSLQWNMDKLAGMFSTGIKTFAHSGVLRVILFLFIPYMMLVMICYVARNTEDAPPLITSLMSLNRSGLQEVAPSTLEILHINQDNAASKNGDMLTIVSGDIFNTDIYSFRNIFLELRTYDKHNRLLKTNVIPLANALNSHEDFPDNTALLDTAKVFSLQQKPTDGESLKLKPNHTSRFQVAVDSGDKQTYYFSVRVYSVKKHINSV